MTPSKIILCLFWLGGLVTVNGVNQSCSPQKVLMNYKLKADINNLVRMLVQYKKPFIHIPTQLTFPRNTTLTQTRISNMTQLTAFGDCYEWIEPGNRVLRNFTIGLQNMTLNMGDFFYSNVTTKNAVIQIKDVQLFVEQETRYNKTSCTQTYKKITLLNIGEAMFNKKNLQMFINNEIKPDINRRMKQGNFTKLVDTYFDSCNVNSSKQLLKLINSPYTTSAAHSPALSSLSFVALSLFWLHQKF